MPRGRDSRDDPRRRVTRVEDNVIHVQFGKMGRRPRISPDHPSLQPKEDPEIPMAGDPAPPHGIPRPKLTKEDEEE